MARMHVSIEGVSAAGKSEAGRLLAMPPLVFKVNKLLPDELKSVKFFEERASQNPFLKDFYTSGMAEEYSFASQMFYLQARLVTNANIQRWNGGIAFEDRSKYGDTIFAENLFVLGKLDRRAYEQYIKSRDAIWDIYKLKSPNGIVLFNISLKTCLKRLQERGTGEKIDGVYWGSVLDLYEKRFKELGKKIPILNIDANVDFWQNENYMEDMVKEINAFLKKLNKK